MGALTVIAIKFLIQADEFFSQVERLLIKCEKPRFRRQRFLSLQPYVKAYTLAHVIRSVSLSAGGRAAHDL